MANHNQFCTFHVDDLLFGVEIQGVQEVMRHLPMTPVPLAPNVVSGLINLRGQIVTAINLRECMGIVSRNDNQLPMNVVIRTDDGPISLQVDEIGDVVEVSDDAYEAPPQNLSAQHRGLVRGVYKLERRLLLVLNTEKVLEARPNVPSAPGAVQPKSF